MPKKQKIIKILLPLLFIVTCLSLSFLYCFKELKLIQVPVASYSLGKRTLIDDTTYKKILVPSSYLNGEVVVDEKLLEGKCVRIDGYIPKGSFFYKSILENVADVDDKMIYDLKPNQAAYDVNANDLKANQAYLKEGMCVDIYLTINKDKVLSDLLISNVEIVGLYDLNNKRILDYDHNTILQKITLALPYDAISYLNKAQAIGTLNLVVGKDCYESQDSFLNSESIVFDYLR